MSSEKTYWAGRSADPADDFGAAIRYTLAGGLEFTEDPSSGTYAPLKNTLLGVVASGNEQSFLNRKGEWLTLSGGQGITISGGTVSLNCSSGSANAILTLASDGSSLQWKQPEMESRSFTIGSNGDFQYLGSAAASAAGRAHTVEFVLEDDLCYGETNVSFMADNVRIVRDDAHGSAGTMPTLNGEFNFRDPRSVYISGVRIKGNGHDPLTFEGGCRGSLDTVEINSALHALVVKEDSFVELASQTVILNSVGTGITASAFGRVHAKKGQLLNYASSAADPPYGSRSNEGGEVIHTPEEEPLGFTISSGGSMVSAGFIIRNGNISSGESMNIRSGGSMTGMEIQSGGSLTVLKGASVESTVLAGSMTCSSGASAHNVTGASGNLMICSGGSVSTFSGYGSICIQPGGLLQSGVISGGALTVSSGGSAFLVDVSSGTQITIHSGGYLMDTVYQGGTYTSDFSGTEIA